MKRLLFSLILVTALTSALRGAPACVSQPYSNLIAAGFECEINAAVFSNFSFSSLDSGPNTALDESQITVSPLLSGFTVGLRFAADFDASGGPNGPGPAQGIFLEQYRFLYRVTRPDSEFISTTVRLNNPTRFSPNPAKFGSVLSGKVISNDGATAIVDDQDGDLMDTGILNTPRTTIFVDELLQLSGGASAMGTMAPAGNVTLESSDNLFTYQTVIPEPRTWILCCAGIAALFIRLLIRRLSPGSGAPRLFSRLATKTNTSAS